MGQRVRALFGKDGLRGPILTMLTGSMVASSFSVIAQPILARLYAPEDFGMLALFVSLVALLAPIGSLRYSDAIMLPRRDAEAANVFWLATLLSGALIVLVTSLLLFRHEIAAWKGDPTLATWLLLLPPTILGLRARSLIRVWVLRQNRFPVASSGDVVNNFTLFFTRLTGGIPPLYTGPAGLIVSLPFGHLATSWWYARHVDWRPLLRAFSWRWIGALAARYRRFPLLSMPSMLLNTALSYMPVAVVSWAFGNEVSGHYWQAFLNFFIPLTILSSSVQHVFFVRAAEAVQHGTLAPLVRDIYDRLVLVGLFPCLGALIVAPGVFSVVLGAEWRVAGEYLRILAPWFFLAALCSPLTRIFDVREKQRADLFSSITMAAFMAPALWWGAQSGSPVAYLAALSASGSAGRLVQLALMLHFGGIGVRDAVWPFVRYALLGAPFLAALSVVLYVGDPIALTIATALSGAGFYGWMGHRLGMLPFGR